MSQHSTELRHAAEILALELALEDALCDLVRAHGAAFLDEFLDRRARQTGAELRLLIGDALPSDESVLKAVAKSTDDALRRVAEAVQSDPKILARKP